MSRCSSSSTRSRSATPLTSARACNQVATCASTGKREGHPPCSLRKDVSRVTSRSHVHEQWTTAGGSVPEGARSGQSERFVARTCPTGSARSGSPSSGCLHPGASVPRWDALGRALPARPGTGSAGWCGSSARSGQGRPRRPVRARSRRGRGRNALARPRITCDQGSLTAGVLPAIRDSHCRRPVRPSGIFVRAHPLSEANSSMP